MSSTAFNLLLAFLLPVFGRADLVLIHACANDVLEFRSIEKVEADLCVAIARAKRLSPNVILMPGHDFSVAPFFLRPMSAIIVRHAREALRGLR